LWFEGEAKFYCNPKRPNILALNPSFLRNGNGISIGFEFLSEQNIIPQTIHRIEHIHASIDELTDMWILHFTTPPDLITI